jgi:hypothetical protein
MFSGGKSGVDLKTYKSLSGYPYTNQLAVVAKTTVTSTTDTLATTVTALKPLPHKQLTTATRPYVASTSANDTLLGTGARLVLVVGLDANYSIQEEVLALSGQTPAQTALTYIRIFELLILNFGSNVNALGDNVPVGDIYCGTGTFTAGVPANPIVGILATDNDPNSRVGIFTVPDGYYALLKSIVATTTPDIVDENYLYLTLAIKLFGFGSNHWFKFAPFYFDSSFQYLPEYTFPLPPKTDIQLRVKSNSAKAKTASIEMVLELKELRS